MKVRWAELFLNSCLFIGEQRGYTCCVWLRSVTGMLRRAGSLQLLATRFLDCEDRGLLVGEVLAVSS